MKEIIKHFYEGGNNGFRVLVAPTGLGKTYAWTEAVCDMLSEEKMGRSQNEGQKEKKLRFIFITPLIKNLPIEQLKEKLITRGIMTEDEFVQEVMLLKSNADNAKENFSNVKNFIEKNPIVKGWNEYNDLAYALEFVLTSEKGKNHNKAFSEIIKKMNEDIREKLEPAFRKKLSKHFRDSYKTRKERLSTIEGDLRWLWIKDMYPGTFIENKRVIFMSLDKFLFKNASIVETSSNIWKSDLVKDACILIDEIDSTKERIFDKIIERSIKGRNLLDMFISCYDAINGRDVEALLDGFYADERMINDAEHQRKNARSIYDDYHLNCRFTLDNEEDSSNFIFSSGDTHIISSEGKQASAAVHNKGKKNVITFESGEGLQRENSIKALIERILGFKNSFQRWILSLAIKYRDNHNEKIKKGETSSTEMITTDDAIYSVISRIFKSESWRNYFYDQILEMSVLSKGKKALIGRRYDRTKPIDKDNNPLIGDLDRYDYDFLSNGFTYIEFENAKKHNEDTFIQMYQCAESPEKIIVELASNAKVIGLSATGDALTVIKNYDIDYLKRHLGTDIFFPSEDIDYIESLAKRNRAKYSDIKIHPEHIWLDKSQLHKTLLELCNNNADKVEFLKSGHLGRINEYQALRYLKIGCVFKKFWDNYDKIPLGYIMLNKIPRHSDKELDLKILEAIFDAIIQTNENGNTTIKSKDCVTVLAGENFNEEKNKLFEGFLEDGIHKLIITTYNTAGAGQNLQYAVKPDKIKYVDSLVNIAADGRLRANKEGLIEIDANFIYLEKPTYIIPNKSQFGDTETFFKSLVILSSLKDSGSISYGHFQVLLRDAFAYRAHGKDISNVLDKDERKYAQSIYDILYKSQDFMGAQDLICEQAIGRMCRTTSKREDIFILVDAELNLGLSLNPKHKGFTTPEYDAACTLTTTSVSEKDKVYINKAYKKQYNSNRWIMQALKNITQKPDYQLNWQEARESVVKNPTLSENEYLTLPAWQQNFYIELPQESDRYWYKVSDMEDFSGCEISFNEKPGFTCVSAESSKLLTMMKNEKIYESFDSRGFATDFAVNKYILCPIIYNNIYKGAIGEFAGEVTFSLLSNEKLLFSLGNVRSDAYELFDYELTINGITNLPICVDFKNWHESMTESNSAQLEKIADKAMRYGTEHVMVVNIVEESGDYKSKQHHLTKLGEDGKIHEINVCVVPALINKDGKGLSSGVSKVKDFIKEAWREYNDKNK